ncbi:mannose-6-phosphate isomerase, class I [Cellulomonas sp. NPDC089187]|uniref:mannose-6-phosphate isomerase, class I n=1 Tax=Cellulomonas sp. NPDC089187 TaxID=3154970 RepID=UPI003426C7C0
MYRLTHAIQHYSWGSPTAIPSLLGIETTGEPIAEAWFGAHPSAPSHCLGEHGTRPLDSLIAEGAAFTLGADVEARFGATLPYLMKVIAADSPLSLQVHPQLESAREGFDDEEMRGVPLDAPHRNYRDRNHKPELVYAVTKFEALCGFRAPRRAAELLTGLDAPLARRLRAILAAHPTAAGIEEAFTCLLRPGSRPEADQVAAVAQACEARLAQGSPSPRADRIVMKLNHAYPGDPGVVTSLLLNPVSLFPGEALFVPAGGVHAYLTGVGIEIMASSDNVLRAGLTPKHVDVDELLRNVDYVAAPPIRIAPERFHGATRMYYAPVDDFELSVTHVDGSASHPLPGRGPRIVLCLEGRVRLHNERGATLELERGQACFIPAGDGALDLSGTGTAIQADVP